MSVYSHAELSHQMILILANVLAKARVKTQPQLELHINFDQVVLLLKSIPQLETRVE